jgi:ABC-type transporter MlaC component
VLKSLNESELEDFDIAFNSVFGGHEEAFIEKGIQYILNKLQIDPNSDMGKKISDRFKSLPNEEAKKMIDPQYVSETIVSILPETFIDVSDPSGDGLETIVKNTIAKLAASRTTLDDLTHQISQKVKQSLEDLKNTTIETSSDMKKSYIEKLKSSI